MTQPRKCIPHAYTCKCTDRHTSYTHACTNVQSKLDARTHPCSFMVKTPSSAFGSRSVCPPGRRWPRLLAPGIGGSRSGPGRKERFLSKQRCGLQACVFRGRHSTLCTEACPGATARQNPTEAAGRGSHPGASRPVTGQGTHKRRLWLLCVLEGEHFTEMPLCRG